MNRIKEVELQLKKLLADIKSNINTPIISNNTAENWANTIESILLSDFAAVDQTKVSIKSDETNPFRDLDHFQIPIVCIGPQFIIKHANVYFQQMLSIDAHRIENTTLVDYLSPESASRIQKDTLSKKGLPLISNYEIVEVQKKGDIKKMIMTPLLSHDNSKNIYLALLDTYNLFKLSDTQKQFSLYLESFLQINKGGFWEYRSDGTLIWSKDTFILFGLDVNSHQPTFDLLLSYLDETSQLELKQAFFDHVDKGTPYDITNKFTLPDGTSKWIRNTCFTHWDEERSIFRSLGLSLDVTEEVRKTETNKLLLKFSQNYIHNLDNQKSVIFNNLLKDIGSFFEVDRAYIIEYTENKAYLSNTYEWCADEIPPAIDQMQVIELSFLEAILKFCNKDEGIFEMFDIESLRDERDVYDSLANQGIKSFALIEIKNRNLQTIGFVGFDLVKTKREFTKEEKNFLTVLSNVLGNIFTRDRLTNKIAAEEKKFKYLFDNMAQGVVYQSDNGNITEANAAAMELLGLTYDEITNRTSVDPSWRAIKADYSPFPGEEHPAMVTIQTGLPVKNIEMGVYIPTEDDYKWILVNSQPIGSDNSNHKNKVFTTFTDITDLKKSQKELDTKRRLYNSLVHVSNAFIKQSEKNNEDLINESLKTLGSLVEADRFYIFNYDWEQRTCNNTHEWCAEGIEPMIDYLQDISVDNLYFVLERHQNGKIMDIPDVRLMSIDDPIRQILEPQGIISIITVPLMKKNQCIGFIGLDYVYKSHAYSKAEKELLVVFADMLVNLKLRDDYNREIIESSNLINEIINNSPALIYRKDLSGKYELINNKWIKDLGFSEEEVIHKTNKDIFAQEMSASCDLSEREVIKTGESVEIIETLQGKFDPKTYKTIKFPLKNISGDIIAVGGISTDITEEIQLQLALKKSESNLKAVLESNTEIIWTLDEHFNLTYFNSAFAESILFSFGTNPKVGHFIFDFVPHPEYTKKWKTLYNKVFNEGTPITIEDSFISDSYTIFIKGNIYPIRVEDQINGLAIFMKDITSEVMSKKALEDSEERFRTLFEENTSVMVLVDYNTFLIVDANEAASNFYGLSPEEIKGSNLKDLFEAPNASCIIDLIKTLSTNKSHKQECIQKVKGGILKSVELYISIIIINQVKHLHIIVHDIDEKKKFYEKILAQNQALNEIGWIQSHVIRAPLARMMVITELLKTDNSDEFTHDQLMEEFLKSAQEIDHLIKEISEKSQTI
jgi:PAS domain S-box-containing protein